MMGDDMAVLSGGMYGNPESSYTMAIPSSVSSAGSGVSSVGLAAKIVGTGMKVGGSILKARANDKQIAASIRALKEERQYNIANYEQFIADQVASNKISFWSSGLDVTSGTARDVIESNRAASTADMYQMARQYDTEIKSLQEKRRANRISGYFDAGSSLLSFF